MELLLLVGVAALVATTVMVDRRRDTTADRLRAVASTLASAGFDLRPDGEGRIVGSYRGRRATLGASGGQRLTVEIAPELCPWLSVRATRWGTASHAPPDWPDPEFAKAMRVWGPQEAAVALLDRELRRALVQINRHAKHDLWLEIEGACLTMDLGATPESDELAHAAALFERAVDHLPEAPIDVEARLLERLQDPEELEEVRFLALQTLLSSERAAEVHAGARRAAIESGLKCLEVYARTPVEALSGRLSLSPEESPGRLAYPPSNGDEPE